jgi:hypothetical protein
MDDDVGFDGVDVLLPSVTPGSELINGSLKLRSSYEIFRV